MSTATAAFKLRKSVLEMLHVLSSPTHLHFLSSQQDALFRPVKNEPLSRRSHRVFYHSPVHFEVRL